MKLCIRQSRDRDGKFDSTERLRFITQIYEYNRPTAREASENFFRIAISHASCWLLPLMWLAPRYRSWRLWTCRSSPVSLTQTQGGLSATADEIAWVQTVCLIADVVIVPLSGTMSRLLSTRVLFVAAALGFTGASVLCATATSLGEMSSTARCKASAAAPVTSRLAAGSVRADGARLGRSRPRADATRNRKFADSPLEGNGFEPLVPQRKSPRFPKHSGHRGRLPPGRTSSRPFTDLGSADCPILGSGLPGRRTGGGPDRFSGIDNGDGLRPQPAGRGVTRLAGPDFMIEIVVHRPARP